MDTPAQPASSPVTPPRLPAPPADPLSPEMPPRIGADTATDRTADAWQIIHTDPDDPFTARIVLYRDDDPRGWSIPLIDEVAVAVADVLDRQVAVLYPADGPTGSDGDEETEPAAPADVETAATPVGWLRSRGEQFSALIGSKQADAYLSKLPLRTQAIIGGLVMLAVIVLYFYTRR